MSNTSMQGGATSDAMTTQLMVRGAKMHDLSFVITNQGKTNRLIARIEGATGPADTPETPDFSQVSVVMSDTLIDPVTAELKDLPAATFNNYRVLVKSAVVGAKTNFRAYCEKSDAATGSPLQAGAFDRYFKTSTPPANLEPRGRGLVVKGTNLDLITQVVVYDDRNPTAEITGIRVTALVAPYSAGNIMDDGLGAYLNNPDGTELMVVWPVGFVAPVNTVALVDGGTTADAPRETLKPTAAQGTPPSPVITSVTSPEPLAIRVEGTNLGGAGYLLTERAGDPRNYDKGGWFGQFGAPMPTEETIEIRADWGADNLGPVDEAGIRDKYGVDTVATGLAVDMDDPGTSAAPSITSHTKLGTGHYLVSGANLDAEAVQRLTFGFTNGSITAYKPGGPLEPYNAGNGITVLDWSSAQVEVQSPYFPSGTLLGISVQNQNGSSLADYVV